MNKNLGAILVGIILVLVLASLSLYTVDQRQNAIVFRLGEIVAIKKEPGLYAKMPLVDRVKYFDIRVLTIDAEEPGWDGNVGFVPAYLSDLAPKPDNKVAITCGPPIMIKFTLQNLVALGFADEQIYTTLEMKMKCGVGKCGRCNIGHLFVCVDGPVFSLAQLRGLPAEF